jgi:HEAT repeats
MSKPRASAATQGALAERTPSETTALLVEFGRAVKARSFYAASEPEVRLLFSRAWRSFQADLRRHGALEIEVAPAWLRVAALALRVPNVQLGGLAQRLTERGVRSLRFDVQVDADALAALVELLAADPEELPGPDLATALYARVPAGVVVNRVPAPGAAPAPPAEPEPAAPSAPQPMLPPVESAGSPASELFDTEVRDLRPEREAEPPAVAEAGPAAPPDPLPEGGEGDWSLETDEPAAAAETLAAPDFAQADADVTPAALESSDATPRTTEDTDTEAVEPGEAGGDDDLEVDPGRAGELEHLMRELSESEDDFQYHDLARKIETLAAALGEEGHGELAYRSLVLFARHAGDDGKRSVLQRDAAMDHLQRLATGMRLADLVDRACAPETESSLEATQVLLRLGANVVAMLFQAAERESEPGRRGQLHGILIAMGDAALPEVMRAFESGEVPAMRAAARLAGELQNPKTVAPLAGLLEHPEPSLRQEAAKALVRVGDPRALDALARALESPLPSLPNLVAFCLGTSGSPRAADALLGALRRAVGRRRYDFAVELVRALGRLGREEAAADLATLLAHRGLRHRSAWRELKLAAAAALGRVPGDEAVAALAEAARARDPQLRRAAQSALDRRAAQLARSEDC